MTALSTASAPARPGDPRPRRAGPRRSWRYRLTVLSFIGPALLGIAIFLIYPLAAAIYFSFTRFSLLTQPEWFGLGNYQYMLHDPALRRAVLNTLWLIAVMVPAQILFGLSAGYLLTKARSSAAFYRTIFYLPALVPPVAGALAFVYILKPGTGPVNHLLQMIGFTDPPQWFNSPTWAKPSLTLLALWGIGNTMMIFLAALLDVPVSLHEAAALDGAGSWKRFRHVTLPSISPVILFSAITGIIAALQYFTEAAVAGSAASGEATVGGGAGSNFGYPEGSTFTYPLWLYLQGFRYNFLGYASAMAVVLFVVAFAVVAVMLRRARFMGDPA
jgi:multiple sugar transport system permease protein